MVLHLARAQWGFITNNDGMEQVKALEQEWPRF